MEGDGKKTLKINKNKYIYHIYIYIYIYICDNFYLSF